MDTDVIRRPRYSTFDDLDVSAPRRFLPGSIVTGLIAAVGTLFALVAVGLAVESSFDLVPEAQLGWPLAAALVALLFGGLVTGSAFGPAARGRAAVHGLLVGLLLAAAAALTIASDATASTLLDRVTSLLGLGATTGATARAAFLADPTLSAGALAIAIALVTLGAVAGVRRPRHTTTLSDPIFATTPIPSPLRRR